MTTGSDTTSDAAIRSGQAAWNSPRYVFTRPGGSVCFSGPAGVSAKTRSALR